MSDQEWNDFKTKFNKTYKDDEEEQMRKNLFLESKQKVEEHNKRFAAKEVTFSMGINAFSDNTPEEHAMRSGRGGKQ